MANFVQIYKSTDSGAPVLTGQASKLIDVLNACLVNGYTPATVGNITRSGSTATVVLAAPNATLVTGNYVTIAGCDQADYNITAMITVTNTTTFTYQVANSPATPATTASTITYKKAPLGWSSPFTGTNKAVYRSNDVSSNRFYCQVYDNGGTAGGTIEAQIRGFETMIDVDTGSQAFPTALQYPSGLNIRKSSTSDATARAWTVYGDDKTFWIQINYLANPYACGHYGFGHFVSTKPGDNFNTFIIGGVLYNSTSNTYGMTSSSSLTGAIPGLYFARAHTQIGGSINGGYNNWNQNYWGSAATLVYPHSPDGGAYFTQPVFTEIVNGDASIRGKMPGIYQILHTAPFINYNTITNVTNLPGITFTILDAWVSNTSAGQLAVDTFGPWT